MLSLAEIYGRDKIEGVFGPELEVEYKTAFNVVNPDGWIMKGDDSLRNWGVEFIAAKPFTRDEITKRIQELCKYVVNQKGYISKCPRTSFHVHYNVSDMTLLEISNCIVAYWLLEDSITKHCGKLRQGNQYCLSSSISTAVIDILTDSTKRDGSFPFYSLQNNNRVRYTGQNLCSIPKLMSLENRVMNGDAENVEALTAWVNNLDRLYLHARTYSSPDKLCDAVFNDPMGFMVKACDPRFMDYLDLENVEQKLVLVSELAYETDWNTWAKSFKKKTKKDMKVLNPRPMFNLDVELDNIRPGQINIIDNGVDQPRIPDRYRLLIVDVYTITFDEDSELYIYTRHDVEPDRLGLEVSYEDYCIALFGSVHSFVRVCGDRRNDYYDGKFYGRDY